MCVYSVCLLLFVTLTGPPVVFLYSWKALNEEDLTEVIS